MQQVWVWNWDWTMQFPPGRGYPPFLRLSLQPFLRRPLSRRPDLLDQLDQRKKRKPRAVRRRPKRVYQQDQRKSKNSSQGRHPPPRPERMMLSDRQHRTTSRRTSLGAHTSNGNSVSGRKIPRGRKNATRRPWRPARPVRPSLELKIPGIAELPVSTIFWGYSRTRAACFRQPQIAR